MSTDIGVGDIVECIDDGPARIGFNAGLPWPHPKGSRWTVKSLFEWVNGDVYLSFYEDRTLTKSGKPALFFLGRYRKLPPRSSHITTLINKLSTPKRVKEEA